MRETYLQELRVLLTRVRRRWMTTASMGAGARASLGACTIILVAIAADYLLEPADLPMLLLLGGAGLAVVMFAAWALWPLRRVPTDRQVARFVEEHCPELEDRVASATEVAAGDARGVFHDLVLADAASKARDVDVGRVVTRREIQTAIGRGAVAVAALLIALFLGIEPTSRAVHAAWLHAFPTWSRSTSYRAMSGSSLASLFGFEPACAGRSALPADATGVDVRFRGGAAFG